MERRKIPWTAAGRMAAWHQVEMEPSRCSFGVSIALLQEASRTVERSVPEQSAIRGGCSDADTWRPGVPLPERGHEGRNEKGPHDGGIEQNADSHARSKRLYGDVRPSGQGSESKGQDDGRTGDEASGVPKSVDDGVVVDMPASVPL